MVKQKIIDPQAQSYPPTYTWASLNEALLTMPEDKVFETLQDELRGARRMSFVLRAHARYNVLRAIREREDLYEYVNANGGNVRG
mgnify:CR=1 FL=1